MEIRRYLSKFPVHFVMLAGGLLLLQPAAVRAQHVHINAGASNAAQDAPLVFSNGANYNTAAGYDVYLTFTNAGSFSNLYQGAGATFTALASTLDNGGPAFGHASDGSFLQLQFVSMSGPAKGEFAVWEQDPADPSTSYPSFKMPVGTVNGTNLLALSESDGSPGADPYGHIHGRTFTASRPGLYKLGCRLLDTSSNGAGGGPIHTPSDTYYFYFQAGLTISSCVMNSNSFEVTFGTATSKSYYVESTSNLQTGKWTTFAGPFTGNNHLQSAATNATPPLFLRLREN
jgi:hypothetical protein